MQFKEFAEYFQRIESVSSRLKMIEILADMFKKIDSSEISMAVYMTQGVLAAPYEGIEFGLATKMAEDALSIATGKDKNEIESLYKKSGDLGLSAEMLMAESKLRRMRSSSYTIGMVYDSMIKISKASGKGSKEVKVRTLAEVLAASTPIECKYIIRYPLGQLRLGAGDSTILEALSVAHTGERRMKEELEHAYNICSDLGFIAEELYKFGEKGIKSIKVTLFRPIKPALAERLPTPEQIIDRLGGRCAVEQKYDGFRCQVHKSGNTVRIYSRNLEETTDMFPDIVKATKDSIEAENVIFEGEALAYNEKTSEFLPFQETIQRKRKHDVKAMSEQMPLHLMAFDIIYLNGKSYMDLPYNRRREELGRIISQNSERITLSNMVITKSAKELNKFFEESIESGLEGIVAKDLNSSYIAGARKFSWIKLKRSYKGLLSDTLDLVILGYYLGKGSRAEFKFGGLLCGVYNKKSDMFETISRIGTGFSEDNMKKLSSLLSKIRAKSKPARVSSLINPDFWVDPVYVVTVRADEITRSPMHTCCRNNSGDAEVGYALRFPRIIGTNLIREDKRAEDCTSSEEIDELFKQQKKVTTKF